MPVSSMLPELLASGQVPEEILAQMEAARDPAMGYTNPRRAFPQGGGVVQGAGAPTMFSPPPVASTSVDPQTAPRMEEFQRGSTTPTFADLYKDNPAMGYADLRRRGLPQHLYLNQVPLQGKDLERYENLEKQRFEIWKARTQEKRLAETERATRERESVAAARQRRLDEADARKAREAAQQDRARLEGSMQAANNAIATARKAYMEINDSTLFSTPRTGFFGGLTKWIPGSDAFNLDQRLEPLRAITSFEQLNRMKEASRTGGALGQIAVRELELLASSVASLNTSQDAGQLKENLRKVIQHFQSWKDKVSKAWEVEGAPKAEGAGAYDDPEKEKRYQEFKRRQGVQ